MFKITSAEIKKIVSKPGIYILSILLAIVLILGVLIYKPTVHESSHFELKGSTYVDKYTDFTGGGQANVGKKAQSQTDLENAITSIKNYTITYLGQSYTQEEYINELLDKCVERFDAYLDSATDNTYQDQINTLRENLVTSFENLNAAIDNAFLNSQYGSYSILSSNDNYDLYKSSYKQVLAWAKISVNKENLPTHFNEFENKYKDNFYSSIDNFKYPTLSSDLVETYTTESKNTKLSILNDRLDKIEAAINEHYALSSNDPTVYNVKYAEKMDNFANLYVDTINTYVSLIKYELISNAFSVLSTKEQLNVMYLSDYSAFNSNSLLARYDYLFENNNVSEDYARPLTIGVASNNEVNAYDYAYFVLKIFSFIIIVYSILAACHSIAGEVKEGSMRYLAIRPISRSEMFFGKWFAILLISIILMLFSAVISLCVGTAVYGMTSQTILTIFNGNVALTIHPIGMIGIYLVSMLLELIIYSLIAMLLSVLFKSDLMSMTILLVLYLLNLLMPIFIQGSNSWLAFYPFSHISLYSMFGSSVYAEPNNFFNLVFGAKVYAGSHFALTLSLIFLMVIVLSFVAIKRFKKKEL